MYAWHHSTGTFVRMLCDMKGQPWIPASSSLATQGRKGHPLLLFTLVFIDGVLLRLQLHSGSADW